MITLIPPEAADPTTYGLSWGSLRSVARSSVRKHMVAEGEHALLFRHTWEQRDYRTLLTFAPRQGLIHIALTVFQTRAFLDDAWTFSELEQLEEHTRRQFHALVEAYTTRLGAPHCAGDANTHGFPQGETALEVAEWQLTGGSVRLRFDQPDTEAAFYVELTGSRPALEPAASP